MPRTIICSGCGRQLLSTLVICPECATPVPQQARPEEQPEAGDKRPFAPPPPREEGYRPPYHWMGTEELPGQPAPPPAAPKPPPYQPPAPTPPQQPTQNLFCPGCGRGLPQQAAFCPQCGRPVQAGQIQPQPVFQPVRPFSPLPPPGQKRSAGEQAVIAVVAIVAAILILTFFC